MERGEHIRKVVALIESNGHQCALVGGVAVSIRALERFTKDIDFAVAVRRDAEAEALALVFQRAGYGLLQVFENSVHGSLATLRFSVPGGRGEPELDLLFASSGIEPEIVSEAEPIEVLPGLVIPVARTPHLIAMKVLAESNIRGQDRVDLQSLLAVATELEVAEARQLVRLILQRGFARGKQLEDVLAMFLDRST